MKEKCSYADEYKAKYPPKCGCKACKLKWKQALKEKRNEVKKQFGHSNLKSE